MGQPRFTLPSFIQHHWRSVWLGAMLALYLMLASYQLGLPGLHYDEAREAGVNALELLTGAPVTAFRSVSLPLFGWHLPLMVQDYIGALNVYLALPGLALTGIGVPNLRALAILIGLAALLMLERAVSAWQRLGHEGAAETAASSLATPVSLAGLLTITLLVASPSFIFWSRQGIFVTNLTQPFTFYCLWQALSWLRSSHTPALIRSAFAGGLAIYAKFIAVWIIGPFVLLVGGWWLGRYFQRKAALPRLSTPAIGGVVLAFLLPLLPIFWFDWQTGAAADLLHKLDHSYYGVNNRDFLHNLPIRWAQLLQSLRGDHLWYLGAIYRNGAAPWLAGLVLLIALGRAWRTVALPLGLLALVFGASLFTISDLFVTHYALVQPFVIAVVGIGLATWFQSGQKRKQAQWRSEAFTRMLPIFALVLTLLWSSLDLTATLRYHAALQRSGGLADHSDASYHLAYYLRYQGLGAPLALDWGIDAPVRYLSEGAVTPIEIFGYASPRQPDAEFGQRLRTFLANPQNVYLLHAPAQTVFVGRREQLAQEAKMLGLTLVQEKQFTQRDGTPLFEIWRALP